MEKKYRYPGIRPFTADEKELFFGRDDDKEKLLRMITLNKITLLYSKSGMGKSSLINAGIIPLINQEKNYFPIIVRLGRYVSNQNITATQIAIKKITNETNSPTFLDRIIENENSLWYNCKELQIVNNQNNRQLLLIFDQFEELFSYPENQIIEFKQQLAELLFVQLPQRFRDIVSEMTDVFEDFLSEEEKKILYKNNDVKVLFSIRNDRLSLLNQLTDQIPTILRTYYELQALTVEQAKQAIELPALQNGEFISEKFRFHPQAIESLINYLSESKNDNYANSRNIESFQLQLICQYAENIIINEDKNLITPEDLEEPDKIFKRHYQKILKKIPEDKKRGVRVLIEDNLIIEGSRVALPDKVILSKYKISPEILYELENSRLLRKEPNTTGGISYELSHDSLVAPILESRKARVEKEEEETQIFQKNKELQKAHEKQQRQRKTLIMVGSVAVIAFGAFIFTIVLFFVARKAKLQAEKLATGTLMLLQHSLPIGETDVFAYYLRQADTAFVKGKYDEALGFYQGAILLSDKKQEQEIQQKILNSNICINHLNEAVEFVFQLNLEQAVKTYHKIISINPLDPTALYRIKAFEKTETLDMLKNLKLITINGGYFIMGSENGSSNEKPTHKITLSDYQISTYEVTNEQFATFLNQYKNDLVKSGNNINKDMIEESEFGVYFEENTNGFKNSNGIIGLWKPAKGFENYPIVNVTWFGAYEFCYFYGINLSTEAQWEYAAKGGLNSKNFEYSGSNNIDEVAEYKENNDTHANKIGNKKPNELGVFDMSGNVWEWCGDWYYAQYYVESPNENPQGPPDGSYKVYRGGSWDNYKDFCRVAIRYNAFLFYFSNDLGFRVAFY